MDLSDILKGTKKKDGTILGNSPYESEKVTSSFYVEEKKYSSYDDSDEIDETEVNEEVDERDRIMQAVINFISKGYGITQSKIHSYSILSDYCDNIPMLCYKLEKKLGYSISPEDEKNIRTIGDLVYVLCRNGKGIVQDDELEEDHVARIGDSSEVEITNPSYDYDQEEGVVRFSMERLDNISEWNTGELAIYCWTSEKRFTDEEGWGTDNYSLVGQSVIGHLETGYGFPDVNRSFEILDGSIPEDDRWHFVFTINELSSDGKWYIIDYRNGTCNLGRNDYDIILKTISKQLDIDEEDIEYESLLMDDFGADELDITEIIMKLEKKFHVFIPDERVAEMYSVADLIDILEDIL